ncbi:DUF397 domain-containing protein [Nocardiopsis sp. CNT-189]|uniref:DUF397 domain-containing protein n=1 Tax=Nocardiopsis oceanisediminis TaxID=2816862 RepID=UPI003B386D8D
MPKTEWHKSSYSTGGNSNCVECRASVGSAQVRDTQNRSLGHLEFGGQEWAAFLLDAKADRF